MPGLKVKNEYSRTLGRLYDKAPKAVLAAIAVSYATVGGDHLEDAQDNVLREWWTLHEQGIIPQRPPFPKPEPTESAP